MRADQVRDLAGAVQKTVVTVAMEMNKRLRGHRVVTRARSRRGPASTAGRSVPIRVESNVRAAYHDRSVNRRLAQFTTDEAVAEGLTREDWWRCRLSGWIKAWESLALLRAARTGRASGR